MLDVYADFAESYMAMPVIKGEKTAGERFPGRRQTLCIEAMMQDRKAIQAGTSHFLGQNFSKASGIQFQSRAGSIEYAWTTSWAQTTRLIGTLIMAHGDDDGLVLPPRIAPAHAVIIPITPEGGNPQRPCSKRPTRSRPLCARCVITVTRSTSRSTSATWAAA